MESHSNDTLSLYKEVRLVTLLEKEQKILFSCDIVKFSDGNKYQPRIFMITDQAVYNIQQKENFIKSMMSKLVSFDRKFSVQRKMPICSLEGITLSNCENNDQFVIHILNEYDYRYRMEDSNLKKQLLKILCMQYQKINKKKIAFYFKDDITLIKYCTSKTDIKNKINKKPKDTPIHLNFQDLVDYETPGVKFELLYSLKSKNLKITNFVTSLLERMKETYQYFSIQTKNCPYEDISKLMQNQHQFITLPHYVFRANDNLYLLRPMMIGGKMDKVISTKGSFNKQLFSFYISQIILILEYLHSKNWVYRAVCLSNIYIKENGYIAIDGLNKFMRRKEKSSDLFYDICGLSENLPPQMIMCEGQNQKIDIWGLGICAYNMISGEHPFMSSNVKETFKNILYKKIEKTDSMPQFVYKALSKDPKLRPSLAQIKKDTCFSNIDWEGIEKQVKMSPYIPELNSVFNWEGKLPSIVYLDENKK